MAGVLRDRGNVTLGAWQLSRYAARQESSTQLFSISSCRQTCRASPLEISGRLIDCTQRSYPADDGAAEAIDLSGQQEWGGGGGSTEEALLMTDIFGMTPRFYSRGGGRGAVLMEDSVRWIRRCVTFGTEEALRQHSPPPLLFISKRHQQTRIRYTSRVIIGSGY